MAKSRAGAALVAVILIAAFAIRFAYVENTSYRAVNDAGTYNRLGGMIARTGDYDTGSKPGSGAGGSRGPTAYFPPGFPYFLAAVDIVDGHTAAGKSAIEPARVAQAVLGTVAVGFVGLVGLEAFGVSVALVCMVLAALYPVLIELSGTLVAENLLVVLMLAAIWTALRARRSEHPYAWLAATGVLTGLATLTHQNAFVILLPLAFAAVAATRARSRAPSTIAYSKVTVGSTGARGQGGRHPPPQATRRASPVGAVVLLVGMTVLTIAPWTIRNALQLHHFIPVSDETGITLVGTYNPQSAEFSAVPYKWRFFWKIPEDNNLRHHLRNLSEPVLSARLESQALHYIGAHPLSPLEVAYHNTLRMFEIEGTYAWHASADAIDVRVPIAGVGVISFWLLCIVAALGIATRTAREAPRWIWAIPLLMALTVVFINVETPRFREPIDPFLVLLAGCAIEAALARVGLVRESFRRTWRPAFDG